MCALLICPLSFDIEHQPFVDLLQQLEYSQIIPNSFGVSARARQLVTIHSPADIHKIVVAQLTKKMGRKLILGGGTNLLLRGDFDGLVIANQLRGIDVVPQADGSVLVTSQAGENWSDFVDDMVERKYWGLENLSLIPGNVGASPIQNIGAYGVEMCDRFESAIAVNLNTGEQRYFGRSECAFAYRDSLFKQIAMQSWMITAVVFRLERDVKCNLAYGDLHTAALEVAAANNRSEIGNADVAKAVKQIRGSKLPDPAKLGNAGSFFKNPIVSTQLAQRLKTNFADLPIYPIAKSSDLCKLSAGWMIDSCGWKGFRDGDAGVHVHHALVLVNYGGASGAQIWHLAEQIMASVKARFEVELQAEPLVL